MLLINKQKNTYLAFLTSRRSVLGHAGHKGPAVGERIKLFDGVETRDAVKATANVELIPDGNCPNGTERLNNEKELKQRSRQGLNVSNRRNFLAKENSTSIHFTFQCFHHDQSTLTAKPNK